MQQSNHQSCTHMVHGDDTTVLCGMHAPIAARMPPIRVGRCEHIVGGDHWCDRPAAGGERLCARHMAVRENERMRMIAAQQLQADAALRAVVRRRAEEEAAAVGAFHRAEAAARARAPAVAANPMARLAADRQNVHTTVVAEQTSAGEAKLLSVKTDGKGVGLKILRFYSMQAGTLHKVLNVMNDVDAWYTRAACRTAGYYLYRRVLEGLWTLIEQQDEERCQELKKRLWEEMTESVGMCCEGHISRLVNVMVGFDDAFKPKPSAGEILQSKIAEIAGMKISEIDKQVRARTFMTGVGMSAEEMTPWLEALA